MSNPTDTNQASEDELIYGVDTGIPGGDNTALSIKKGSTLYTFVGGEAVAIIDVIRTEKLKLLAEVRERVVGEDKPLQGKYRASGLMSYDMTNHYENSLRAEQRAVLTKLEAEL